MNRDARCTPARRKAVTAAFPQSLKLLAAIAGLAIGACTTLPTPSTSTQDERCLTTTPADPSLVPAEVAAFFQGTMKLQPGVSPAPMRGLVGNSFMWVVIGEGGVVVADPGPDGRLGAKFPTYRLIDGRLIVGAVRLDGPTGNVAISVPAGYGTKGFQATGVDFPSGGCWSVTESVAGHDLAFVVRVVQQASPNPG
jgi:hypothetical protein